MKTKSIWCRECDHEHECEVVSDEFDDWVDVPDACENCGETLVDSVGPDKREDFHSDG